MTNSEQLEKVRNNIVAMFIAEVRIRRGIPYYNPSRSVFDFAVKAAKLCLDNNWDPGVYVKAQLFYNSQPEIYPSVLCTSSAASNVRKYIALASVDLDALFEAQKRILERIIFASPQLGVVRILDDPMIDFSPWFRVLATKNPVPELMKKYNHLVPLEFVEANIAFFEKHGLDYKRLYVREKNQQSGK